MRRAYKFRLRPTATQHVALAGCLDAHRELYNAALQERRDAYERVVRRSPAYWSADRPKGPITYSIQSGQLKEIRAERPDMGIWSFSSQQATLRRLNRAFEAFFRRAKAGEIPGYPRFKAQHRFDCVEWPKDGDGCKWRPEAARVYLRGIGHVKATVHRRVEGLVKTISVKREGKKWFLVLSCDDVPKKPLEPTGRSIGLDMGIASFATTSDGAHIANPRHAEVGAKRLARAQRVLVPKLRGSNNRAAARETVAARHRKVAHSRRDFHHKVARRLVEDFDVIYVEDLCVANMVRRVEPVPDPETPGQFLPNAASAKTGLNRSINDAGWAQFRSLLCAKAEDAGRTVLSVNPRHTSQRCAQCGHTDAGNRISQAQFRCLACGHEAHAGVNAARNILGAGLALPDAHAA
ncbi:MAG TPA: transposase [Acidimicrobiales bacterium]|nr:transposase [Acidimicrobiales bacterium]